MKTKKVSAAAQSAQSATIRDNANKVSANDAYKTTVKTSKKDIRNEWLLEFSFSKCWLWLQNNETAKNSIKELSQSAVCDKSLIEKLYSSDFKSVITYLQADEKLNRRYLLKKIEKEVETGLTVQGEPIVETMVKYVQKERFTPTFLFDMLANVCKVKR